MVCDARSSRSGWTVRCWPGQPRSPRRSACSESEIKPAKSYRLGDFLTSSFSFFLTATNAHERAWSLCNPKGPGNWLCLLAFWASPCRLPDGTARRNGKAWTPRQVIQSWSLTSLRQRLFKTGDRLIRHARWFILQLAEGHLTRARFGQILGHRATRLASDVRTAHGLTRKLDHRQQGCLRGWWSRVATLRHGLGQQR